MKAPVVSLLAIFFSGTCGAALEHLDTAALEQACECARAHLLQPNDEPVSEIEKVNEAWENISNTMTEALHLIHDGPDKLFPAMVHLTPVIDVVKAHHRHHRGDLEHLLEPSYATFLEQYLGARDTLVEAFVAAISQIARITLKLPTLKNHHDEAKLTKFANALKSPPVLSADELAACWAHIEAMTKYEMESARRRISLTELANKLGATFPLTRLHFSLEEQLGKLKTLDSKLQRGQEWQRIVERHCQSLEFSCNIIGQAIRNSSDIVLIQRLDDQALILVKKMMLGLLLFGVWCDGLQVETIVCLAVCYGILRMLR